MSPRVLLFTGVAAILAIASGASDSSARSRVPGVFGGAPNAIHGNIVVPPEWAGVWSYTDTTYSCAGDVLDIDGGLDTLCAGTVIDPAPEEGIEVDCTGGTTPTTINMTCTYNAEIFPDCNIALTVTIVGTRTGETFHSQNTVVQDYSGTGKGCDFFPDDCRRTSTRATRVGPAPEAYCATPVEATTWGQVKSRYR